MKTAFSIWNDRIAPVFDVAGRISIIESEKGKVVLRSIHEIPAGREIEKAEWLIRMGVQNLICGAISRDLEILIASYGIRIIPFIAGETERIIRDWLAGASIQGIFYMPGCRRGRNHRMPFPVSRKEGNTMDRMGQGGMCVCPGCGHREPHERGIPCIEKDCPECGQKMVRE